MHEHNIINIHVHAIYVRSFLRRKWFFLKAIYGPSILTVTQFLKELHIQGKTKIDENKQNL